LKYLVKIGTATSFRKPENWDETEDDRLEKMSILGGTYLQDNGVFACGVKGSIIFAPAEFDKLRTHRNNRDKVVVADEHGNTLPGTYLVKITGWKYEGKFNYYRVELELLRKD
jgi:hypothetical protein